MTTPIDGGLTVEWDVHVERRGRGSRKVLQSGPQPSRPARPGRVPRVARLMALALRCDHLIREGAIENYSEIARVGQVTRVRVSQIMNLLNLAPDLQETLLFLPRTLRGRDPIHLGDLQPIASTLNWQEQRQRWLERFPGLLPGNRFLDDERTGNTTSGKTEEEALPLSVQ